MRGILSAGSRSVRVREEFSPTEDDRIVKKTAFGAFTSPTIDATLRGTASGS